MAWQKIEQFVSEEAQGKWVKTDDTNGRILGRVFLRDGEYSASRVVTVNDEGLAKREHRGFYLTLELAQTAVDRE